MPLMVYHYCDPVRSAIVALSGVYDYAEEVRTHRVHCSQLNASQLTELAPFNETLLEVLEPALFIHLRYVLVY
jgi:hypothetical protein